MFRSSGKRVVASKHQSASVDADSLRSTRAAPAWYSKPFEKTPEGA